MRYRKKPVVIDAVQLRWDTWNEMCDHMGIEEGLTVPYGGGLELNIPTLEGTMVAKKDDWIIKGVKGELYPCKPDIFEATYEKVED
jgi:hypothetical protein